MLEVRLAHPSHLSIAQRKSGPSRDPPGRNTRAYSLKEDFMPSPLPAPACKAGSVLAVAMLASAVAPCSAPAQTPVILKVATVNAGESPRNLAANEFARVVAEKSGGRIKAEVYINNQLARGEGATLEGVQIGTIDIAPVGSAPIGGIFEPAFLPLDLPFLWTSREQIWKVMDGPIGQELFKKMEAKGVKGLCWGGGWGFRNMLSNVRAVASPEDLKGQTVRVQESPIYIAMMKELGATPVPMAWGEVYLAMKQRTVDAMELPVFTVVSDKFYEVTKFYSLTRHSYPPISWYTNLRKHQALPADLRQVVEEAAAAACALDRKAEIEKEKADLTFLGTAGVQVNDVKDLSAFQSRMKPAYDVVTAKVGKDWMDKVTAAAKAAQ
jgi:TRAP-type transport system periplasmic protein